MKLLLTYMYLRKTPSVFLKDIDVKRNSISHFHVLLFFGFDCAWWEEAAGWTQKTLRQSGKMPGIFPNNLSVFLVYPASSIIISVERKM